MSKPFVGVSWATGVWRSKRSGLPRHCTPAAFPAMPNANADANVDVLAPLDVLWVFFGLQTGSQATVPQPPSQPFPMPSAECFAGFQGLTHAIVTQRPSQPMPMPVPMPMPMQMSTPQNSMLIPRRMAMQSAQYVSAYYQRLQWLQKVCRMIDDNLALMAMPVPMPMLMTCVQTLIAWHRLRWLHKVCRMIDDRLPLMPL
jgi:hypothetical protein